MGFVIDATIFGAWVFSDERNAYSEAALNALTTQKAVVPPLWWYETRNLMIMNEHRGRIRPEDTNTFLQEFDKLPISTDQEAQKDIILKLARKGSLSIHEASYLELALRLGCPLATLNKKLAHVAFQEGVSLFKQSNSDGSSTTSDLDPLPSSGSSSGPLSGDTKSGSSVMPPPSKSPFPKAPIKPNPNIDINDTEKVTSDS